MNENQLNLLLVFLNKFNDICKSASQRDNLHIINSICIVKSSVRAEIASRKEQLCTSTGNLQTKLQIKNTSQGVLIEPTTKM